MAKHLKHEDIILPGTFGDREVHLCRCVPTNPNDVQIILLHGVHSSANITMHNKFRYLAELLTERGFTPWLVETSRLVRNRHDFGDDIPAWIEAAFKDKTFSQEQQDAFTAVRYVISRSESKPVWVWGFSLGGIIAVSAAGEAGIKVDRVILGGTGLVSYDEVEAYMMKLPILSTLRSTLSPDMIEHVKVEGLLSFRGSNDEIFSEESCLDMLNRINIPPEAKHFHSIEGADHSLRARNGKSDPGIMREMVERICRLWLCILLVFLMAFPASSSANEVDYKSLQEDPLETAFRKLTSQGGVEWDEAWDEAEMVSGGAPVIVSDMKWPMRTGYILGYFNRYRTKGRRKHHGIDLGADKGTPIYAVLDGIVEVVSNGGKGFRGYGRVIIINHDNKLWSLYSHCSTMNVKVGQRVKQGQHIAGVGRTGRATANHLHFEIRNAKGIPLDPMKYLPKDGALPEPPYRKK